MLQIRRSHERGKAEHGWLSSRHTFSFAGYHDPDHMGFQNLRVINEDKVVPGAGFGTHPHRDMEIISYVLAGGLEHKDSMGTGSIITPGEVQLMSAGRGVLHSEFNASQSEDVKFLQIWIIPSERGGEPGYQQRAFSEQQRQDQLRLLVAPSSEGNDAALSIKADAKLYGALLGAGQQVTHELLPGRSAWVQVARGDIQVNGELLNQGDGAALREDGQVVLTGVEPAEVLVFDLPDLEAS